MSGSSPTPVRVLPVSESAILLEYPSLSAVLAHEPALLAAAIPGVREFVPAARTILVRFDPAVISVGSLARKIRAVAPQCSNDQGLEPVVLNVVYGGEDLDAVAASLHLTREALIQRHIAAHWQVAFVGFAPGFAYCIGDDEIFSVPRRTTPRTRIPAGSVALAANYSAVYPTESPGGWQLIGRTEQNVWDMKRADPALLHSGQTVRYRSVRASAGQFGPTQKPPLQDKTTETGSTALEVLQPGAQALLQDLGRTGHLHIGVPESGAADAASLRAANRIVGNEEADTCIEFAGGGAQLLVQVPTVVGMAGAHAEHSIRTADGTNLALNPGEPTAVDPGDVIEIGIPYRGLRSYLAVRGGFLAEPILGSRSSDTLSGIGPAPLRAGDHLQICQSKPASVVSMATAQNIGTQLPHGDVVVRFMLGQRRDWFTESAISMLVAQRWEVSADSNRVGIRLQGDHPLSWSKHGELPSEGCVTGVIQVPPDGQPVLFLNDHPVTGGYPIIGAVAERDLDLLGQLAPGDHLRFQLLDDREVAK